MAKEEFYQSPLVERYASKEMSRLFGARHRIVTWRRLWLALAKAERRAGLKITAKQIKQLEDTIDRIDFSAAARYEKKLRHDVMAHLKAWGDVAQAARGILHVGATSAFVVDNADLIIQRDALRYIAEWSANVVDALASFAKKHRAQPTLGFTHFQPAQPTTVGRRFAQWAHEMVLCHDELEYRTEQLLFRRRRGLRGATGTQASYLALFDGDSSKVDRLEAGLIGCPAGRGGERAGGEQQQSRTSGHEIPFRGIWMNWRENPPLLG